MDRRYRKSQYAQEDIFDKLFYPKGDETHTGIFLEIGASDGVDISNSYYLEKVRDWIGLLVEPIGEYARDCFQNRWATVWNGCVYDKNGEVDFLHIDGYSKMLSCITEASHPSHNERIRSEVSQHNQKTEIRKISCKTINSLLDSYNMKYADFMSIDCQTAELKVLQAYDITKNPIKAILIDFNAVNIDELTQWFKGNGYELYWKHTYSDEHLYVNNSLKWSWE